MSLIYGNYPRQERQEKIAKSRKVKKPSTRTDEVNRDSDGSSCDSPGEEEEEGWREEEEENDDVLEMN